MSEEILKALMQLFAIIGRPESNASDRRSVVESFLNRQLNQELVDVFLHVFDEYYRKVVEEDEKVAKKQRLLARRSVRVLKICTAINEELAQPQKIIVLFQLLEFIKSETQEVTGQEMEFVTTVADTFNIPGKDYQLIRSFVLSDTDLDDTPEFLIVDNNKDKSPGKNIKHIYRENLVGQIRLIHIQSTNLYFLKYVGQAELYMNGQLLEPFKSYPLNTGSSLRYQQIAPVYYSDVVSLFVGDMVKSKIVFEANHITYRFKNGAFKAERNTPNPELSMNVSPCRSNARFTLGLLKNSSKLSFTGSVISEFNRLVSLRFTTITSLIVLVSSITMISGLVYCFKFYQCKLTLLKKIVDH